MTGLTEGSIGIFSRLFGAPRTRSDASPARPPELRGPGTFAVEVIGEARYGKELDEICARSGGAGDFRQVEATIVLEDENPHQTNAVRVEIDGVLVGFLARQAGRACRDALATTGDSGATVRCAARIRCATPGAPHQVWVDIPAAGEARPGEDGAPA